MELVLSTSSLESLGGSETYLLTIGDQLQRMGHEVLLHALDHGAASEMAQELGLRICRQNRELPDEPDALIVQDGVVAYELAARYPSVPQVFVAHSDVFDLQLPPQTSSGDRSANLAYQLLQEAQLFFDLSGQRGIQKENPTPPFFSEDK